MKFLNDKTYNWLVFNAVKISNITYVIVAIVFNIYMYDYYNESFVNYLQVIGESMLIFWLSLTGLVFTNILLSPLDKWGIREKLRGKVILAETEYYTLYYFPGGIYHAGCRIFNAKQAISHWSDRLDCEIITIRNRAKVFLHAVKDNEESLK